MSRQTHVEVGCDTCSCACHYHSGVTDTEIRADGWIITKSGNHFDSKECYEKWRKAVREIVRGE